MAANRRKISALTAPEELAVGGAASCSLSAVDVVADRRPLVPDVDGGGVGSRDGGRAGGGGVGSLDGGGVSRGFDVDGGGVGCLGSDVDVGGGGETRRFFSAGVSGGAFMPEAGRCADRGLLRSRPLAGNGDAAPRKTLARVRGPRGDLHWLATSSASASLLLLLLLPTSITSSASFKWLSGSSVKIHSFQLYTAQIANASACLVFKLTTLKHHGRNDVGVDSNHLGSGDVSVGVGSFGGVVVASCVVYALVRYLKAMIRALIFTQYILINPGKLFA